MGEELKSVSICLLDDVHVRDCLKLDEFDIRDYQPTELQALLGGTGRGRVVSKTSSQWEAYASFPWAYLERSLARDKINTGWERALQQFELSWKHAGVRSWWPFDDLLRTLNLLKPTGGPVIARQFYYWLEPLAEPAKHIDRVIYGEPLWDYDDPESDDIHPLMFEYHLEPSNTEQFSQLRRQLARCFAAEDLPSNSHLKTAIHYFENGDRKFVPHPLPGSFDAIEPLMFYEAALEALMIREGENSVEGKLAGRTVAVMKKAGKGVDNVADFTRRVFWLRSKVAHGARPTEEIESLITHKSNDEIVDKERNKTIPAGDYANLLVRDGFSFPGFLVNLRELTRICIRFFCEELSAGRDKATTIDLLKETS